MAPRLSRWIAMTAVATVLVATLLLTTGGTPLIYLGYGRVEWDGNRPTLVRLRYDAIQNALGRISATRDSLELHLLLDGALRGTTSDPVVFRRAGDRLVAEPSLTSELQSLWADLPLRRPGIRTVVVIEPDRQSWRFGDARIEPTGLCVVRRMGSDWAKDLSRAIRALAGECFVAESFGMPGAGIKTWMRGLRFGLAWQTGTRYRNPMLRIQFEDQSSPVWFQPGARDIWGYAWRNWPVRRAEKSCLVGRLGQCEEATGVGASGWPGYGPSLGYVGQVLPNSAIPRDLLTAIGPARFGQIWTSADPVATSYARVTGAPMGPWLREWAERYVGPIQRDNGLSLLGWIGALVWLSLFGLLTFERLKQRAVT